VAFVVETGAGTPDANAYCTVAFVTSYLTDLGRETENGWSTASTAEQQEAIVDGTRYLDSRHGQQLRGSKLRLDIEGREATGTLTLGAAPLDTETVTIGQRTYRFVTALAAEDDVLIGGSATAAAANLAEAINSGGDGTGAHASTRPHYEVEATSDGAVVTIEAQAEGANGNAIALSTTVTGASVSGAALSGGIDQAAQPLEFPRAYLYDRYGVEVLGVPLRVRQATAEYAVRALSSALDPDPTTDDDGALIQRKREEVGPIVEETEYAQGAALRMSQAYPAADRLLADYVYAGGGVVRW